ncbi:MAG: murein hydrolase activator EnvC family protein, partial [Methyloligellaceae bacterium]
ASSDKTLTKTAALVSPARIKPARPFEKSKGLLPIPVRGRRIKEFGTPNEYGGKSKGLLIESRSAAQITSPSDGWVVYAGVFRSYGQLLIINAGGGYHILLAGMKNIDVSEGQFVLAGEPVATMGPRAAKAKDSQQGPLPVLYVEFRKDGHPINPGPWWSDGPEKAQG